ncbi:autotransporter outer membrane beta-barrel domain-containing protein [Rhodopseudomonas sp. HC1]|uniref:autotransporter family protein n=1 Tax=Rhodopseudomonas infernalis TaxID=2897386 RepID=UPI001EE97C4D|nr:autotransporter outer membrane beta-barrel domain-containing protein [Rhodopseudomonas infernalis]MCG6207259.1 autotransporter outer membrane beta-barrel domain-containing protein [Rhodopseudomonas infernalis]
MSLGAVSLAVPAAAASFNVGSGATDSAAKTVTGTDTGTVQSGGTLNVSGTAISFTGPASGVVINNSGTISSGNRGIDTSGANPSRSLTLNNFAGALISTVDDAFRLNTSIGTGTVVIDNCGTIVSNSGQVFDFASNSSAIGTVQINNNAGGIIRALGNDAIRPGSGSTTIINSGLIDATTNANRGINLNISNLGTVTSFSVINNAGGVIQSTDDTIRVTATTLATTGSFTIDNAGTIWSTGTGQAIDFNDISSGTVQIINRATGVIRSTGADAVRPGEGATVTNYGLIYSDGVIGSSNDGIDWQSHSGTVNNKSGGTISGFRHGITTDADVVVTNETGATIIGRNGSGVGSDGTGTVVNYGRITGAYNGGGTGDGDGVDVDFAATVTNYGVIEGTGAGGYDSGGRFNNSEGLSIGGGTVANYGTISGASYGIVVNNDSNTDGTRSGVAASTITNYAGGTIIGQNGFAIRLENKTGTAADNDSIVNSGTIIGNGAIPDPNAVVLLQSGAVDANSVGTLDGVTYTGTGSARFIRGDGSAIQMGEGADVLTNSGTIIGNNGRAVNMEGGNDTVNIMPTSRIVGLVNGGTGTDTLNYDKIGLSDAKRAQLAAGQTVNIGGTLYTSFETVNALAPSFSALASSSKPGSAGPAWLFDNLSNSVAASADALTLIDSVANAADVGAALAQLSPASYQALGRMTLNIASQTGTLIDQRLMQSRFGVGSDLGGAGAALAMADAGMFGASGSTMERTLASLGAWNTRDALAASGWGANADALAYAPVTKAPPLRAAVDPSFGVFVGSSLSTSREGARPDVSAIRSTTANVVAGADWRVSDQWVLGAFGGYALTSGDLDALGSTTKITSRSIGGYGSYRAPWWYANVVGFYGWDGYDNRRAVLGTANSSRFDGNHYTVRGAIGTDLRMFGGFVVTPELSLQYTRVATDGFTEAGGITALSVAADRTESLRSSVGTRIAHDVQTSNGVLTPELRLAWLHEFKDGVRGLDANFVEPTLPGVFTTFTGEGIRDRGVFGTGVTGRLGQATLVSLGYDAIVGSSDAVTHLVTGRVKVSF